MLLSTRRPLRGAVLGMAMAATVLSGPAAFAGSSGGDVSQDVNVTIGGGDAKALAGCVNIALLDEKKADYAAKGTRKDKRSYKKWQRQNVRQLNFCDNLAEANGGTVTLKNVDIRVDANKDGKVDDVEQNVTVTITGGDAAALAACANVFDGGNASVKQENDCINTAIANGGDVNLNDVDIVVKA